MRVKVFFGVWGKDEAFASLVYQKANVFRLSDSTQCLHKNMCSVCPKIK